MLPFSTFNVFFYVTKTIRLALSGTVSFFWLDVYFFNDFPVNVYDFFYDSIKGQLSLPIGGGFFSFLTLLDLSFDGSTANMHS